MLGTAWESRWLPDYKKEFETFIEIPTKQNIQRYAF